MPEYRVPTCSKCGGRHYNFEPCPDPDAGNMRAAVVVRQPRPGYRDWQGDKLRTVKAAHGQNTVLRRDRRYATTGRVLDENHRDVKLPQQPAAKPTLIYPEGVNNG